MLLQLSRAKPGNPASVIYSHTVFIITDGTTCDLVSIFLMAL